MSDETHAQTATQAAADASGQAPASPPSSAPQAGTDSTASQQSSTSTAPSVEELQRIIADLRKEAAANRTKAKQLDDLLKQQDDARLTEVEKAQKAAETERARAQAYQQRIARSELKSAAMQAGIIDAQDAIDLLSSRVEYDDDGEPTNVAALVDDLKQAKPHWFKATDTTPASPAPVPPAANSGGATNPSRSRQAAAASAPASVAGQRGMSPMRYSLTDPALWKRS